MRDRDPRDGIRRPIRTAAQLATRDVALRDIDGWQILALYLEGRITARQASVINSRRLAQIAGRERHAA